MILLYKRFFPIALINDPTNKYPTIDPSETIIKLVYTAPLSVFYKQNNTLSFR